MEIVKLKGAVKDYLWGGNRLFKFGKTSTSSIIAESWEISFRDEGATIINSGTNSNKLLKDIATISDLGTKVSNFAFFPILNKLIDAKDNLSIQVHPNDEYALKNENSYGKTEMWYVVDAEEDSVLYIGFNKDVTDEEIKEKIVDNTLIEILNKIHVKPNDCFFVPSGIVHAIGKGCLIYEIQENSNLTYRIFDYGRKDKNGNNRELHIEKALQVINKKKFKPVNIQSDHLAKCEYFVVNKLVNPRLIKAPKDSFLVCTVINGNGKINDLNANQGDSFFFPCGEKANVNGDMTIITTNV